MVDIALFPETDAAIKWISRLQRKTKEVKDGARQFANILSPLVFKDVVDHFEEERGPKGRWKAWSKAYAEHMERIGKGGNKILQDTGRLRQGFTPSRFRTVSEGILWYNPVKYARRHDEGDGRAPARPFMWLGSEARESISQITLNYILEDAA